MKWGPWIIHLFSVTVLISNTEFTTLKPHTHFNAWLCYSINKHIFSSPCFFCCVLCHGLWLHVSISHCLRGYCYWCSVQFLHKWQAAAKWEHGFEIGVGDVHISLVFVQLRLKDSTACYMWWVWAARQEWFNYSSCVNSLRISKQTTCQKKTQKKLLIHYFYVATNEAASILKHINR